jgi:hypothetical protein
MSNDNKQTTNMRTDGVNEALVGAYEHVDLLRDFGLRNRVVRVDVVFRKRDNKQFR